ncbi:hypothetical protein KIM67_02765 [Flagellimonas sp. 389]|uniref:hypothetical protein n=1 Tax=Flagellimonas sp. 389 TaxID=2835862 RepID=UPI001BD698FC|nr:hypothetical protein [Flagellimonas sp. 389]MBS9461317.1 hypothetical protein [Flagellimonas sp. 389]
MQKTLIILVLLFTGITQSQELKEASFVGKWELNWSKSGFFPKDDLLFKNTTKELSDYIFKLNKDGSVEHKNNSNVECPVGVFTMRDGNWKFDNGFLTLELRGEKIADFWYWWIIQYKPEKKGENLYLKVEKVIKNHQIPPTKTWEQLIGSN